MICLRKYPAKIMIYQIFLSEERDLISINSTPQKKQELNLKIETIVIFHQ